LGVAIAVCLTNTPDTTFLTAVLDTVVFLFAVFNFMPLMIQIYRFIFILFTFIAFYTAFAMFKTETTAGLFWFICPFHQKNPGVIEAFLAVYQPSKDHKITP
jgi:hypothetical protein